MDFNNYKTVYESNCNYRTMNAVDSCRPYKPRRQYEFKTHFIAGLNILDLINNLRNEDDEDLIIQCDVFDEEKQSDDEEMAALNPACVDINDHKEVFNALYHKVRGSKKKNKPSTMQYTKNPPDTITSRLDEPHTIVTKTVRY